MNQKNEQMRFGPSGNSNSFYEHGYKRTQQAPKWIHEMGLSAFEYPFGRGVKLGEDTGNAIAQQAQLYDVALSAHAPYFINLAFENDQEKLEKNVRYFLETAIAMRFLNADRLIFHPGSAAKQDRKQALTFAKNNLQYIISILDEQGYADIALCPETMGKVNQLGDLNEVIALCQLDDRLIPTIDFGHLHARDLGALNTTDDFAAILDALENGIGLERAKKMHVHFSRIEFTKQGEKKHHTFADTQFGPSFVPLAPLIVERNYTPRFICESNGTMAEDALFMKETIESYQNKN